MSILIQINSVINSGSTGRIAEEIGQLAITHGWTSYIAYGRNDSESNSRKIKIGNSCYIRWHGIQTRLFDKHGLASKSATRQLIKQIEIIKPDIIHLHNIHGYYLNIEILFNYLASIDTPIVWTLHDCWPITGHCSHFSYVECEKWKTQCFSCPQKQEYPGSLFFDRSRQNFILKKNLFTSVKNLTLIPVSNWLNQIVSESFLNDASIKTIHNGINTDVFTPLENHLALRNKYAIQNQTVLLGVASVWSKRKGFDDFIKLSERLPNNIIIILVGLSKQQIKGLPQNIKGIQRTESVQELAELYNVADLFINPTWEDNFPTTNLEALACGTPVLTYRTGGSVESVTAETGFVIEQGDINAILQCVDEIEQRGKRFYSEACRNSALAFYKKEDRYAEYIELYNSLLRK
ncbi:glycosyltransferase [Massilibacteroides vaginae]|uniref:glycosyltransferase n=1 Tax=Massilibacteroides vaginae TaxID=1673718 RepID=UPI000A1CC3C1|nr:glycosyltransferase [Massilibacteroides vaginae]